MPRRVEINPEIVPIAFWPSGCPCASCKDRSLSDIEVFDIQIEVKLLGYTICWPSRRNKVGSPLKRYAGRTQTCRSAGGRNVADCDPVVGLVDHLPPENARIKGGKSSRVWAVEYDEV
jgi:hypothetical protein